jgi:hypothetical protein
MAERSQYFRVVVGAPNSTRISSTASYDITEDIDVGVSLMDEDKTTKQLTFDLSRGWFWSDILARGMDVSFWGGTLEDNRLLFTGYIKTIEIEFKQGGRIVLKITAISSVTKSLGLKYKDLIYPSENHPKPWATLAVLGSDIVLNLAKDSGFKKGRVSVTNDISYTLKKPVRQNKKTDWAFMQYLADKMNCRCWVSIDGKDQYINLVDESELIDGIADRTFYFPARISDDKFFQPAVSERVVEFLDVKINLDTAKAKKGKISMKTNSKGVPTLEYDLTDEGGSIWVLDEEKLRGLGSEKRNELIQLFLAGKVAWEDGNDGVIGAKDYFKEVKPEDDSSRDATPNNLEVVNQDGKPGADGITTSNSTTVISSEGRKKVVLDKAALKKLTPEQRTAVMGRIVRGEATEEDKELYTVEQTDKTSDLVTESRDRKPVKTPTKGKKKRARDAGFNIKATISGDLNIETKSSYVLEGLLKYSDKYYLYRINYEWGRRGFLMHLTFTK